ncbi:MAG: hypothetical protein FJX71_06605 [Alphaproteobacteria bacterium]|nr:hypothetical protein [Alphaproteobacteria bacterium]
MAKIYSIRHIFFIFFLYLLGIIPNTLMAAENNLETYLKRELDKVERYDPPVFKLVTKQGREVYIFASIHTVHPEFLLPQPAFRLLQSFFTGAILFTEHPSLYDYLIEHLKQSHVNETSRDHWDPTTYSLSDYEGKIWTPMKNHDFSEGGPKIGLITKIEPTHGAFLCYNFALTKFREIVPGFESTLRTWKRVGDFLFLEKVEPFLTILGQNQEDVKNFFKLGLKTYNQFYQLNRELESNKERAWLKILNDFKESIHSYDIEKYLIFRNVQLSTLQRNKLWCTNLMEYISHTGDTSTHAPISIVCGAAHIRGMLTQGCGSFLELLFQTGRFSTLERMNKEGQWKKLI